MEKTARTRLRRLRDCVRLPCQSKLHCVLEDDEYNGLRTAAVEDDRSLCQTMEMASSAEEERLRHRRRAEQKRQEILGDFFPSSTELSFDFLHNHARSPGKDDVSSVAAGDTTDDLLCSEMDDDDDDGSVPIKIVFEDESNFHHHFLVGGMQLDDEYKASWHSRKGYHYLGFGGVNGSSHRSERRSLDDYDTDVVKWSNPGVYRIGSNDGIILDNENCSPEISHQHQRSRLEI